MRKIQRCTSYTGKKGTDERGCYLTAVRISDDTVVDGPEVTKTVRESASVPARIMLAAGFASVLVEPCGGLPFFVHLWGNTEGGKTVALMLAASIWANPRLGEYVHSFNGTEVTQELSASFVNSMPLILDELQILKEKKILTS